MKSLVLPASLLASACAGASPPPPVVPISHVSEPAPMTTTTTSACAPPERTESPPINVTVTSPHAPVKTVDPALAAAVKRLPPFEQMALVSSPASLKTIDGKLRLHGKNGYAQVEVTLPGLTTQCEQTIMAAIQTQRPVELKGKGRVVADQVPGHGYVSAWDLEDVTSCIAR